MTQTHILSPWLLLGLATVYLCSLFATPLIPSFPLCEPRPSPRVSRAPPSKEPPRNFVSPDTALRSIDGHQNFMARTKGKKSLIAFLHLLLRTALDNSIGHSLSRMNSSFFGLLLLQEVPKSEVKWVWLKASLEGGGTNQTKNRMKHIEFRKLVSKKSAHIGEYFICLEKEAPLWWKGTTSVLLGSILGIVSQACGGLEAPLFRF
ncbi:hypothetical protein AVEN_242691-1 [Araneus ventricosus]|uniref:Uncharacterized protein n=1 Tax=Araneus ventricosus TaxID=182803 RepID=A0A4Y2DYS8_ARAVE|nr:hypothetical protein AVEN_242691-1 [Araneus ventricosus]